MTLTLELTPEQEDLLRCVADRCRRSVDEYSKAILLANARMVEMSDREAEAYAATHPIPPGESAWDAMKDHIGQFDSGEETAWSENTGEKFTDYVAEKHRQGRL